MTPASTVICTVGTSLLRTQLGRLSASSQPLDGAEHQLLAALKAQDWSMMAELLSEFLPGDVRCGAEVNSLHLMRSHARVASDPRIVLMVSDTELGQQTGDVLRHLLPRFGFSSVEQRTIVGLTDADPQMFRRVGLRSLAREICTSIRNYGSEFCAINATGGYKAQIAIAVTIGQAARVPVYYKHELFNDIISFPPMPVSFDFSLWLKHSSLLATLANADQLPLSQLGEDSEDITTEYNAIESLVDVEQVNDELWVALSPTGQIVHETFRHQFLRDRLRLLPPVASHKQPCRMKADEAHLKRHQDEIMRFMERIRDESPYVVSCHSDYFNPDLPKESRFRMKAGKIRTMYSDGTWSAGIVVETDRSATPDQLQALCFVLNEWLGNH
ncbi:MAG: putative CRISPR-associated protein [Planctomycetaceae bacterium]